MGNSESTLALKELRAKKKLHYPKVVQFGLARDRYAKN